MFIKFDMTRGEYTLGRRVKAEIRTLSGRVPKEDTGARARFEFVGSVQAKPGKTLTTKDTETREIGGTMEYAFEGGLHG